MKPEGDSQYEPSEFVTRCQQALAEYLKDRAEGISHELAILPLKKVILKKD